ncbi:MAG: ABC transporter ATP-binding protein [Pirellulales bacterium]
MLIASNLTKAFQTPQGSLAILNNVSLSLSRGEAAAIMGPSGSGKSTLLYILGALDPPSSGTVTLDNQNLYELNEKDASAFRNQQVGFVFQDHSLLPQCSVLENVLTPTLIGHEKSPIEYQTRARELLDKVDLGHRLDHRPSQLSGGEKQRVAIARALVCQPTLLLCDEPTGNLDQRNAESVAELLLSLHRSERTVLVVVTHSTDLANRFSQRLSLVDGRLITVS